MSNAYSVIHFKFQAFVYPENVAYPVGGPNDHTDIVIEMHYNNPNEDAGMYIHGCIPAWYTIETCYFFVTTFIFCPLKMTRSINQ